jgi:hypothetical protein
MKTQNKIKNDFFFLVIFLAFFKPLIAQNDSIFPNLRGEWEQQYYFYDNDPSNYFIGKLSTRKLDENFDTMGLYSYRASHDFEELLIAKIYSDTLKVYVKKATNEEFIDNFNISFTPSLGNDYFILYDFSLEIGDTAYFSYSENDYQIVNDIDSLLYEGKYKKKLHIGEGDEKWIQGLGSTKHPIYPILNFTEYCEICRPYICSSLIEYEGNSVIDTFYYEASQIHCIYATIIEQELNLFKIYPNPLNSDYLTIENDKNIKVDGCKIYDSKLCELKNTFSIKNINDNIVEIDLKDLSSGFYTLEIKTDNKISRQKFIKL